MRDLAVYVLVLGLLSFDVLRADEPKLLSASVLGLRLGDTYKEVCGEQGIGGWAGLIGNPKFRDKGTMRTLPPSNREPYDAQLEPPSGTEYLGGKLRGLNLYFDFDRGDFRLFAIAFQVEDVPLERVLTKQFGPMTTNSGWASDNTMLLLQKDEVLIFDIRRRDAAEGWYHKNRMGFSP